jgi:hypothetical protein
LNLDATHNSDYSAAIANVGGVPTVAWHEDKGSGVFQAVVKQLGPSGWTQLGGSLNTDTSKSADYPAIAAIAGYPYAIWDEPAGGAMSQIYVKTWTGSAWSPVGGSLNVNASQYANEPTIAGVAGVPTAAFDETNGTSYQLYVEQFTSGAWHQLGGALNVVGTNNALTPAIADVGGTPYVTWSESIGGSPGQVYVDKWNGTSWVQVGASSLNRNTADAAVTPSIATIGGAPYVAWAEADAMGHYQLYVDKLTAAAWTPVGGVGSLNDNSGDSVNASGTQLELASVGGAPFVAWVEIGPATNGYWLFAKRFNGTSWTSVGTNPLNVDPTEDANSASLADVGGVPYVAWNEDGSPNIVYAKRLEPSIGSESTSAVTSTGATLSAQVNDFGVPLPIAFEYGTTGAFGTKTALQTTSGAGAQTVSQTLTGLAPTTTFDWRAFGSDTVRETAAGSTQVFTTLALPPVCQPVTATTPAGQAVTVHLNCTGAALTYAVRAMDRSARSTRLPPRLPTRPRPDSAVRTRLHTTPRAPADPLEPRRSRSPSRRRRRRSASSS